MPFANLRFSIFLFLLTCFGFIPNVNAFDGFVKNEGQWNGSFIYKSQIKGGNLFIEKNSFTWLFYQSDSLHSAHHHVSKSSSIPVHAIKTKIIGANKNPLVLALEEQSFHVNYFLNNNPKNWKSELRVYKKLLFVNIYPNIDLEIISNPNGIKYNFIVKKYGNPDLIKLEYEGADNIKIKNNAIVITTSLGEIKEFPPIVYQEIDGENKAVATEYYLENNSISFRIKERYNRRSNLIIDPILVFSTYSGALSDNFGFTATFDSMGNAYSGGTVYDFSFPTTVGAFQMQFAGGFNEKPEIGYIQRDCGIMKFSSDGKSLLYATFLGGRHNEQPHSMIVNNLNQLIVFGSTRSHSFPSTSNFVNNLTPDTTDYNIFVSIFSPNGNTLVASALIGGSLHDGINGDLVTKPKELLPLLNNYADDFRGEVIVDNQNNIYIASSSFSFDFPQANSFNPNFGGPQNGVIVKFNPNLSSILFSSFIGGQGHDAAYGLAIGLNNDVYVTGGTSHANQITGLSGERTTLFPNDSINGFLLRINRDNGSLINGTLVGTNRYDQCYMVKTDKRGFPYVFGQTKGQFPISPNVYNNPGSGQFIAKYSINLENRLLSTVLGSGRSTPDISPTAFLIDRCDKVYISGWGGSVNATHNGGNTSNMPTKDAIQPNTDGSDFWLAVLTKDFEELYFASYYGGISPPNRNAHEHVDGGTSRFDEKGVIYQSVCAGCGGNSLFPSTSGSWSTSNNSSNCNNAIFKIDIETQNKIPFVRDTFLTVQVGSPLNFSYKGYDFDKEDTLFFNFESPYINGDSIANPKIQYTYTPGKDSIEATFSWVPTCNHLTGDTINIRVKITDTGCPTSDSSFANIKILVTAPPLALGPQVFCISFLEQDHYPITWEAFDGGPFFKKAWLVRQNLDSSLEKVVEIEKNKAGEYLEKKELKLNENNYCYFILTENICGMLDTLEFRICSLVEFNNPILGTEILTATVPDNKNVEIIWSKTQENDFRSYRIFKRKNSNSSEAWKLLTEIFSREDTSYIDNAVNVAENSHCYAVMVTDECGNISDTSNIGCNIVLKGISQRWFFDLEYNKYKLWETGVQEYELYRSVDTGIMRSWAIIAATDSLYRDENLDYWWGGYYYKVIAKNNINPKFPGRNTTSMSNQIYLIQPPLLHVPSAFSPNADNFNDTWGFVPVFVKDFHMRVFNRWGEMVFETKDKGEQWAGSFMSHDPKDNVYIWIAVYTGWDENVYRKTGTVTVLK